MSEMNERNLDCCPPPHQCPSTGRVTMGDWMQYINTYIDVRARQIYDKLKALITGGSVNKIIAGTPNVTITPESGTGEVYISVDGGSSLGVNSIKTNSSNVHISPSSGKGDVYIDVDNEPETKDYVVIKDKNTDKKYKIMIIDGDICTDEI